MTVLSYTNAFPGIPFPNHSSGQSKIQNYLYPGAVAPSKTGATTVLTPSNAFPGIAFPQHLSGQTSITNFLYPGAVQPLFTASGPFMVFSAQLLSIPIVVSGNIRVTLID
jgi:hypothetical protein